MSQHWLNALEIVEALILGGGLYYICSIIRTWLQDRVRIDDAYE